MLEARWDVETGWAPAFIVPIGNFSLNPSTKALMYGQFVFDSIRANMGYDNRIRLLRPLDHLANLRKAATRMALPDFDDEELLICMKRLVLSDASLIPAPYSNASLEIRVAVMGSDSKIEIEPSKSAVLYVYMIPHTQVSLLQYTEPRTVYVDPQYARSWPGSLGEYKTSNNYATAMLPTHTAHELGKRNDGIDDHFTVIIIKFILLLLPRVIRYDMSNTNEPKNIISYHVSKSKRRTNVITAVLQFRLFPIRF